MRRCRFAAWGFVALAALPVSAEPRPVARDDADRLSVELDEAHAATERAERELEAERAHASAVAARALDDDFASGTVDGEELRRRETEIVAARTRLAAAERNLKAESSRLTTLEALVAKATAEQKRVAKELAERTRALRETSERAAKTKASMRHANAERARLNARVGALERRLASVQRTPQKSATKAAKLARKATASRASKANSSRARIRDGRQAGRNRAIR